MAAIGGTTTVVMGQGGTPVSTGINTGSNATTGLCGAAGPIGTAATPPSPGIGAGTLPQGPTTGANASLTHIEYRQNTNAIANWNPNSGSSNPTTPTTIYYQMT